MRTTREGNRFILATLLITVAAVNTGNNLIYLILSLMLSFIVLSVVLLRINLSGLVVGVSVSRPVYVGEESLAAVTVTNTKGRIPAYSVAVRPDGASAPVYCAVVPPGSMVRKHARVLFRRRGLYGHGSISVRSGFPFILFEKETFVKSAGEVLVYPALHDVSDIVAAVRSDQGGMLQGRVGRGDEIHSIRDFRHGDDWRKIHWKASAKAASLLVKEFAEYESMKTTLIIDNLRPPLPSGRAGERIGKDYDAVDDSLFERMVSLTASLAGYFLEEGHAVRVVSCGEVVPFGIGSEHFLRILDVLALLGMEDACEDTVSYEEDGYFLSVLRSRNSASGAHAPGSAVVYADTI